MWAHLREYFDDVPSLTLDERALLLAQGDVQLEEQLGDALQERLHQSEHAQISDQAQQEVVTRFYLFPCELCRSPDHPEALPQQFIIPVDGTKTKPEIVSSADHR